MHRPCIALAASAFEVGLQKTAKHLVVGRSLLGRDFVTDMLLEEGG